MKVTCPISGIPYMVSLPIKGTSIHPHPILSQSISASQLSRTYLEAWSAGTLSTEEIHLLGVALVLKLPVEGTPEFPKSPAECYLPFWSKYLERLAKLAIKLEGKETTLLPKLRITPDSLPHLPHWIDTLHTEVSVLFSPISEEAKKRNRDSYRTFLISSDSASAKGTYDQADIDSIITRGLKGSLLKGKESKDFPHLMAVWASNVGQFPTAYVTLEDGRKLTIDKHWRDIIAKTFMKDGIYEVLGGDITLADVDELLEYCYDEIPVGTLHASCLFKKLEEVREVLEEFRGGGAKPARQRFEKYKGDENELLLLLQDSPTESGSGSGEARPIQKSPPAQTSPSEPQLSITQKLAIKLAEHRKSQGRE